MADDDDDFVVFGTRLVDEQESRGNQRHKPVSDPAATRAQPLHKQVCSHGLVNHCTTQQRVYLNAHAVGCFICCSRRCTFMRDLYPHTLSSITSGGH